MPEQLGALRVPPATTDNVSAVVLGDASEDLSSEAFARWWRETGERELRQVLFWRWDPIGVASFFPDTADEYDGYAAQIVSLLREGSPPQDIADYLAGVEREQMGLGEPAAPCGRLEPLVMFISAWYRGSQDRWTQFSPMRK